MPVGRSNLTPEIQAALNPDISQVYYMIDSDFRTAVQGWSRSDKTGPLDLYSQRETGFTFYTPGTGQANASYGTDAAAVQGAIDAMVDFRGDILYFTPGTYTIGTVLSIDVPNARWLGPQVSTPTRATVNLVASVASAFTMTAAADRFECANFRMVPLTAQTAWTVPANTDNCHFHNIFYDADGIGASTSTVLFTIAGTTARHWEFSEFVAHTDAAQGPMIDSSGVIVDWRFYDHRHTHNAGTLETALLDLAGVGTGPLVVEKYRGNIGVAGAVTDMMVMIEGGSDQEWISFVDVKFGLGFGAAAQCCSIEGSGEAAETGFIDCWVSVVGGGAGGAGTAMTQ